jgi:acyl-CoA synthetase (AMP-forming)/AMP-acid ligase II
LTIIIIRHYTVQLDLITEAELVHQLKVPGSKCIFTDRERLTIAIQATQAIRLPSSPLLLVDSEDKDKMASILILSSLLVYGSHLWQTALKANSLTDRSAIVCTVINLMDTDIVYRPVVLNFNSGTTGLLKACYITHRNLVANSEQMLHLDRMARA